MPRPLYLPTEVIDSINEHIERAVVHAENGYSAAQEEEDSITGELGGALRTSHSRLVEVSSRRPTGLWRWSISYSKFGSKGALSTELLTGADGILDIRVGAAELDQRKTALFQAKNARYKKKDLL